MFSTLFTKMNLMAADDDLPGLDNGLFDEIKEQGGILILIIVIAFTIFYLARQAWGRLIGVVLIGGLVFFVAGSPEETMDKVGNIAEMVFGG